MLLETTKSEARRHPELHFLGDAASGTADEMSTVYANRRRIKGDRGKAFRSRAERVERTIAHTYDTGGMRRLHLRDRGNILKRLLIHIGGCNLALLMRKVMGVGTPKALQDLAKGAIIGLSTSIPLLWAPTRSEFEQPKFNKPLFAFRNHQFLYILAIDK